MISNESEYWNERFNVEQHQRQLNWSNNNAEFEACRPSTVHKPRLFIDGNKWCALYGDNIQDGVAGFGKSPSEAFIDFDINWNKPLK